MNASEFGTELGKLTERAMADGILKRKMTIEELIGMLELQKLELARHFQDIARAQARHANAGRIQIHRGPLPPLQG